MQDSGHPGPSDVLGFFTWDDARSEGFNNELDIELSRWGDPKSKNAQYVIQPFYVPTNFFRFKVPPGVVKYQLNWHPGTAAFTTFAGASMGPGTKPVSEHLFTSGIPPGGTDSQRRA